MATDDSDETRKATELKIQQRIAQLNRIGQENEEKTDPILKSLRKKLKDSRAE